MAKRQLNRRQNWRIEKIQGERAARAAKRESATLETLEGGDLGPEQTGLVIAHFGVQVEVEAQEGEVTGQVFRCHLRANLPALVTGDRVVWRAGNQGIGVIVAQLPRTTELRRPDSRGQLKPVAANVDLIVIVFAPMPEPHANLIDRYLVAAEHAGIRPLLLLNKADLIDEQNAPALNALLGRNVPWLSDPVLALPSVAAVSIWSQVGYVTLFFMAGLAAVPQETLDAARVDGANAVQTFWRIKLPLLRPTMFFVLVTGVISSFQAFDSIYALTPNGGPQGSTDVIATRIYAKAFKDFDVGHASVMALVLFVILIVVTVLQQLYFRRRITYDLA